jgi:hypothetical protein
MRTVHLFRPWAKAMIGDRCCKTDASAEITRCGIR